MTVTIWHNPRCSKSRQALALVQERAEDVTIRAYLDHGPTETELQDALAALGLSAIDITRTGEALFRELGLAKTDPEAKLVAALATHPRLIERPIVFAGGKARLGRPPEQVLDIL